MNMRLETVAPGLAARFRHTPPETLRAAALAVARYAVDRSGVSDPAVDGASADELEGLVARLDDEYFDLQEAHDRGAASQDYLRAFERARAVSALRHTLDPDPLTAASEATYEAFAAAGAEALAVAERALEPT